MRSIISQEEHCNMMIGVMMMRVMMTTTISRLFRKMTTTSNPFPAQSLSSYHGPPDGYGMIPESVMFEMPLSCWGTIGCVFDSIFVCNEQMYVLLSCVYYQ